MTTNVIHLHGYMGKKYGKTVELAAANLFQLMSGLVSRFGPEFKEDVRVGKWHLTDGPAKAGNDIGEEEVVAERKLKRKHIHLLPVVEGASSTLRAVLGVVLIVVGAFTSWTGGSYLIMAGIGLLAGAVAEMMIKPPKQGTEATDDKGSYIYNSAVNVTSQGGPIPLGYGRVRRASSVLITTDFSSDEIV